MHEKDFQLQAREMAEEVLRLAAPLEKAKARANQLATVVPAASRYIGICGAKVNFDAYTIIDEFLLIRRVTNPPGIVGIMRAANREQTDYLGVSRYSDAIRAEITVGNPILINAEEGTIHDLAFHTAALMKLRGLTTLFCPASSTSSWDTILAISDNSVVFHLLDDTPKQIRLNNSRLEFTLDDVNWVKTYWHTALELRNADHSRRFGLAFNLMYIWNHVTNLRVATANIWAGLEALFGDRKDKRMSDALTERISTWIPSITKAEVKKLYNQRCDAVHGRWLNESDAISTLVASEELLRQALVKSIETNTKTLPDWD